MQVSGPADTSAPSPAHPRTDPAAPCCGVSHIALSRAPPMSVPPAGVIRPHGAPSTRLASAVAGPRHAWLSCPLTEDLCSMKFPFGLKTNDVRTKFTPLAAGLVGITTAGVVLASVVDDAQDPAEKAGNVAAADVQPLAMTAGASAAERLAAATKQKDEAKRNAAEAARTAEAKKEAAAKRAAAKKKAEAAERKLLVGTTKASYFWDDGSGRQGDTGLPASGKPMQKGLFASPSWPLGTEGYVIYKGKKAK